MSRDYIEIGCVPADEDCEQVGMPSYNGARARLECETFRDQLRRQFGQEPQGATLRIKSNSHDFGSYLEVVCSFDDTMPDAVGYAFKCEGEAWTNWDNDSREKLGLPTAPRYSTSVLRRLSHEKSVPYLDNFPPIAD